jgi:hypothetical protein
MPAQASSRSLRKLGCKRRHDELVFESEQARLILVNTRQSRLCDDKMGATRYARASPRIIHARISESHACNSL